MGAGPSCAGSGYDHHFYAAVQAGDLAAVAAFVADEPELLARHTLYDRLAAAHIAAANGRLEVLSMVLERAPFPDVVNRSKQTPLMMAAMHGEIGCVERLIQAGANILMFDSANGRTCLHYAAYYGHSDCLKAILVAAQSNSVADSWGFSRFVNVRDAHGATPLHLAARQKRAECVHILLDNGGLASASTGGYCYPGSTPLHLAAYGGSLDCVRELLAWGADRLQKDASGRIPYVVALKRHHRACAALLNPSASEPLVWPSPLKFISELEPEAKTLLEAALMEANRERENKILKKEAFSPPSPAHSDATIDNDASEENDADICCICFEQACTIEVQDCGHQMCAHCTLALCCHNKPDPVTLCLPALSCPFCRRNIVKLVMVKTEDKDEGENVGDNGGDNGGDNCATSKLQKPRRSRNFSEGSSSFKSLSSAMGTLGKLGRGSGRIADILNSDDTVDKL